MAIVIQRQIINITATDTDLDPEVTVTLDCLLPNGQVIQCHVDKQFLNIDDKSKYVFATFVQSAFAAALAKAIQDFTVTSS